MALGQHYLTVLLSKPFNHTVNIYRQKTILAKGNTDEIPTTCKSFSLYLEFLQRIQVIYQQTVIYLQPLQVNYHLLVNYPQTLKEFQVQAKGFAGCGNFICISFSQYSFLPIDIYSVGRRVRTRNFDLFLPKTIHVRVVGWFI